jgi:Fis family transcriptional regulator
MKTAVAQQAPRRIEPELRVVEADGTAPLSKCVEDALQFYLKNMEGHEITNLHRLVMEEVERPLLETVMQHVSGNLSQASKILGMTRSTLRKRLLTHQIDRGS